jgi:hypothetical protein
MSNHFTVYAGYRQFYLLDGESLVNAGSLDFWTKEAFDMRIATNPGIIGVGTGTYGDVRVEIEILSSRPTSEDLSAWDHVVEASLKLPEPSLVISGCPDGPIGSIPVSPGDYRVRVYSADLGTVEAEEGEDWYLILVWPEEISPPILLKNWTANDKI